MDGFENDWQYVSENRSATYTNLDPGVYTFMVKATNSDGIWNNDFSSIALQILPPWWKTWWAHLLYLSGIASVLGLIYVYQKRRWMLESKLAWQKREAHRLRELDIYKSNLYSNITHEFRTPLTVISGTMDLIEENPKKWLATGTNTVRKYSAQLLGMINQILDLQKIESAKMKLHRQQIEVVSFSRYIVEPFEFTARNKNLAVEFTSASPKIWLDLDLEKYATILSNIMSNAIKFTDKGHVVVAITTASDQVLIEVSDSGPGISADDLPLIFDRFYQIDASTVRAKEGTGIGLAICKKLVDLMGGKIEVHSTEEVGSTFRIILPHTHKTEMVDWQQLSIMTPIQNAPQPQQLPVPTVAGSADDMKYQLLIIEDNKDVRSYLGAIVSPYYKVIKASNGEEGINLCIKYIPDLVITDIMMPGMDGFQVIERLQQHELTTHIPIIALTAKNTNEARLKSLKRGADAFILKPFESSQLLAYIQMLIDKRIKLQKAFQGRTDESVESEETFSDPILQKVHDLILKHLSDEQIGISTICKKLHISRSQLHNKITALTGLSTSIYLRKIRLNEARKLMKNPDLQIAEIAYQCGFKDPSYFTRVFKKEYGESPTAMQSRLRSNHN